MNNYFDDDTVETDRFFSFTLFFPPLHWLFRFFFFFVCVSLINCQKKKKKR